MADYKETIIAAPKDSGEFWEIVEYYGTPQEGKYILQSEIIDTFVFSLCASSTLKWIPKGLTKYTVLIYKYTSNYAFSEGYVEENFERWEFKEGLEFKDQDLGLGIVCNQPNEKTLECHSVDNDIQLQNSYKFQTDGYIFTETELNSGKSYTIFMEKIHSIDHTSEPLTLPLRSSTLFDQHEGIDNHPIALPNTAPSMQYSNSSENLQPFFASRMMYVLIACPLIIILMIFMAKV